WIRRVAEPPRSATRWRASRPRRPTLSGTGYGVCRKVRLRPRLPTDSREPPRARTTATASEGGVMKRILIATDGSLSAHEAVEFGLDLAVAHDAAVTFLYVVPVLEPGAPAFAIPPVLHH